MRILLTGATGYIGKRVLPVLLEMGHEVICCVRDAKRFHATGQQSDKLSVIEIDLLDNLSLAKIPTDIDGAFYLVHSMSSSSDYKKLESNSAANFRAALKQTSV